MTSSVPAPGVTQERESVTEAELAVAGVEIARDFPGASPDEFKRYPVLSEGGWYMVIKHQPTLRVVSRNRWRLLGPIRLTYEDLQI
jgi:hypothetical protein